MNDYLTFFLKTILITKKYHFQIIDLRFLVNHNNPKKIQLNQEYSGATNNAHLFMILIGHKEIKMIVDG